VIKIFIDKARSSEAINIYGDGSQSRDFIFVADVAKYTIKMLFSDISGVFNLATGNSITIIELAKTIAHIAGAKLPINFLPKKPTDIIQSQASVEKIKAAIPDFSTVNILEGLTQTINK
jgi:UDP-glucose 4-epimerase